MQENKNTIMWQMTQDIDHVNAKLAFDAAAKGDETAQKVVDSWIEYVGVGIANVINTFEPEVICIGGGVSNQGEVLRMRPATSPPASSRLSVPARCAMMPA